MINISWEQRKQVEEIELPEAFEKVIEETFQSLPNLSTIQVPEELPQLVLPCTEVDFRADGDTQTFPHLMYNVRVVQHVTIHSVSAYLCEKMDDSVPAYIAYDLNKEQELVIVKW